MIILGIESSCDDTSAAVIKDGVLLSNVTASQAVHEAYGGVVPEVASREHIKKVTYVLDEVLKQANMTLDDIDQLRDEDFEDYGDFLEEEAEADEDLLRKLSEE